MCGGLSQGPLSTVLCTHISPCLVHACRWSPRFLITVCTVGSLKPAQRHRGPRGRLCTPPDSGTLQQPQGRGMDGRNNLVSYKLGVFSCCFQILCQREASNGAFWRCQVVPCWCTPAEISAPTRAAGGTGLASLSHTFYGRERQSQGSPCCKASPHPKAMPCAPGPVTVRPAGAPEEFVMTHSGRMKLVSKGLGSPWPPQRLTAQVL